MKTAPETIVNCRNCEQSLPLGPHPVLIFRKQAKILVAGQAPGRRVHETGLPFNDPSGDRLRNWMGIDRDTFYNHPLISIIPMGFCYPGSGKTGDLPPRKECAALWRDMLMDSMPRLETTLAIGSYSIDWHLEERKKKNLTETVRSWKDYAPAVIPMPHSSPRNNLWLRANPWFENEVVPYIRTQVEIILRRQKSE
jgi:uracil-DNA glycosylase